MDKCSIVNVEPVVYENGRFECKKLKALVLDCDDKSAYIRYLVEKPDITEKEAIDEELDDSRPKRCRWIGLAVLDTGIRYPEAPEFFK